MTKLLVGFAVAGLLALSPRSEARIPASLAPQPLSTRTLSRAEVGMASWYGAERQAIPTASGELFDMNKLTGAHRKLPLGTLVRVTNLGNHRTTQLKINDRGPGPSERLIDLSWVAAQRLGFLKQGLTLVEVEVVSYPKSYLLRGAEPLSPQLN